jgi:hypothetical protein
MGEEKRSGRSPSTTTSRLAARRNLRRRAREFLDEYDRRLGKPTYSSSVMTMLP